MKKFLFSTGTACAVMGAGLAAALGSGAVQSDEPAMKVSPHMIVLGKVGAVTVHTNIPAGSVAPGTVTLDGVAPTAVWADDCGHLAARFAVAELGLAPADAVVLTLEGAYADVAAGAFAAEDTIRVK